MTKKLIEIFKKICKFYVKCLKKLIADGYATKEGKDPVMYSLTEAGKNLQLD